MVNDFRAYTAGKMKRLGGRERKIRNKK